ncbi:oxidoreductase [Candidatus Macondimonas diazotrophica]|jgi:coenzyme F420-reducing hydrogenase gamma subunit|uniref:Oxidoreductase n=1 Tax=Candidatus Macondimonas diazotrophica TaxID=2305248 RepID=A0A4Z0FAG2_9GAMM|nr:oxidoreductase [Candidatus Macondimonas diazotrophica]NCU00403.1 oxidoreductase [Candidatus Macondimonas diazotrophica]TFZ82724.1 oxidoreductase [Candidatus Macondimonas diazotrophica]HBG50555.1 oxidoreductase [Gammaproteobacteria bacterium]
MAVLPRLAVWKFASCDGCQLSLLDCEDELLSLGEQVQFANFPEASSDIQPGPYDISLVEGSVCTPHDAARIQQVRQQSRILVTIGACATAGGIQALRNFDDEAAYRQAVYAHPEYIHSLATATPIAEHVPVDFELRGCPVRKEQLLEVLGALLRGHAPRLTQGSVCESCKAAGHPCVLVAHGTACLGPVTQTGCGALCPAVGRGCYGCFGPREQANTQALSAQLAALGQTGPALKRLYRTFNAAAPAFEAESHRHES